MLSQAFRATDDVSLYYKVVVDHFDSKIIHHFFSLQKSFILLPDRALK